MRLCYCATAGLLLTVRRTGESPSCLVQFETKRVGGSIRGHISSPGWVGMWPVATYGNTPPLFSVFVITRYLEWDTPSVYPWCIVPPELRFNFAWSLRSCRLRTFFSLASTTRDPGVIGKATDGRQLRVTGDFWLIQEPWRVTRRGRGTQAFLVFGPSVLLHVHIVYCDQRLVTFGSTC